MSRKTESPKIKDDHYEYLHGYSDTEQARLVRQAKFFESTLYSKINFPRSATEILEPGCGVGAQTEILLRRFPHIRVTGVDRTASQIKRAQQYLKKQRSENRANFVEASGEKLPFEDSHFHGAFTSFFLEHVKDPVAVLTEIRRVLQPGAYLYCTEVVNSSFFLHPYSPATLQYWFLFNDHQWNTGGDPFCGAKLGNHLLDAGYQKISTHVRTQMIDKRSPKFRDAYLEETYDQLQSAAPELLKAKVITQKLLKDVDAEWTLARKSVDAVLFYSFVQARALAL